MMTKDAFLFGFCLVLTASIPACHDTDWETCRFHPDECEGGPGAFCEHDSDCETGFCCTEKANCLGGMCSFECKEDRDCPEEMACEHKTCFFRCDDDEDCAAGQKCEHHETVCEWP